MARAQKRIKKDKERELDPRITFSVYARYQVIREGEYIEKRADSFGRSGSTQKRKSVKVRVLP